MAPEADKRSVLRALWRDKLHVAPRALELSGSRVRDAYEHILAPADAVIELVRPLPIGLLSVWHASPRGHVVVHHLETRYEPGTLAWRTGDLDGVALVQAADLVDDPWRGRNVILRLLDHLLGSDCLGEPLSDGVGATEPLRDVAQRFVRINALGYGHDSLSVTTSAEYLAATWALYLDDPRALNVLDPLMFRLLRDRLMNPRFWSAG